MKGWECCIEETNILNGTGVLWRWQKELSHLDVFRALYKLHAFSLTYLQVQEAFVSGLMELFSNLIHSQKSFLMYKKIRNVDMA
jgi:hypothetical protein